MYGSDAYYMQVVTNKADDIDDTISHTQFSNSAHI